MLGHLACGEGMGVRLLFEVLWMIIYDDLPLLKTNVMNYLSEMDEN